MTLYVANGVTVQGDDFIYVFNGFVFLGADPDAGDETLLPININGIAKDNIEKINGVTFSSLESINGVS